MTTQDYIVVLLGYERIYGFDGGGLERVIKEISTYNLNSILETTSKIVLKLYAKGFGNKTNQTQLIKDIFAKDLDVRKRIVAAIKKTNVPNWAIFADQPLLNLYKLALEYAKKEGGSLIYEADVQKIGHWLLILSDVCMGSEVQQSVLLPEDYVRKQLREYLTRQYFFMAKERMPYKLVRFKDIFEKIRKLHSEYNIDAKFSAATHGVVLNDYISFCFFLLVNWVNKTTHEVDITKEWVICKKKYFEQTSLSMAEIDSVLSLLFLDVVNYKKDYSNTVSTLLKGNDIYPFNFLQLRQRPLIPYPIDCFVCPSPDFLMDKSTDGIYWIIENYLKKKNLERERNLLPMVWGDAFENYMHERFSNAFKKNYYKKPSMKNEEIADGLVFGNNYIFFIEAKYAHWSYIAKLTGKKQDMLNTLKQLFSSDKKIKGLGQLTRSIKKVESNKLTLPVSRNGKKIIPILVVGEGIPMDAYNRKMYEDLAKEAGAFYETNSVLPFIVLDVEEVEMLEAIVVAKSQKEAEKLLSDYSRLFVKRTELGFVRESMQFKNYLHSINYPVPNNASLFKLFDKVYKIAIKTGFHKEYAK